MNKLKKTSKKDVMSYYKPKKTFLTSYSNIFTSEIHHKKEVIEPVVKVSWFNRK